VPVVKEARVYSLCDTTASITQTCSKGIGGSHDLLVKEPGTPNLAWDKCATKNSNKKSQGY
jgi:hypothetical protein